MPRIEFGRPDEFGKWLSRQIGGYKKMYKVYITDGNEVVAIPATSTRPHEYGYVKVTTEDEVKKIVKLLETLNIDYYYVTNIVWNVERETRFSEEE